MSRDLIVFASTTLLPLLLIALTALAAWVAGLVARHIADKRQAAAVTLLAYGAAGVVADLAQHVVGSLKDPSKPGTWTEVAAAGVKLRATEQLRRLYPFAVDVITRALRDPSKVDDLLGTLLEKAVVDLKAKAPAQIAAAVTLRPPAIGGRADEVPLDRPTVAPPEPIAPFDATLTQDVTGPARAVRSVTTATADNDTAPR